MRFDRFELVGAGEIAETVIAHDTADFGHELAGIVARYQRHKRALGVLDYGDLIQLTHQLLNQHPEIAQRIRAGNQYINRTMTGAVVGVQPFGGEGLSGTGPKAGGPHYMLRFATERTLTVNTAAVGGNAALLALDD